MKTVSFNVGHYISPDIFDLESRKVFESVWVFVGLSDEVPEKGCFSKISLWGQSYILANDGSGFNVFRNICPHRGSEIVSCSGKGVFTCPYHGWAFNSSGRVTITDPGSFESVDRGLKLQSLRCEVRGKFIFATTGCSKSLEEYLGFYGDYLDFVSSRMCRRIDRNQMEISANWKIAVENTLESYHVWKVHPESLMPFFSGESRSSKNGLHSETIEIFNPKFRRGLQQAKQAFFALSEFDDYRHVFIFPNLTIATSGNTNFFIQNFVPLKADRTCFISHGFLPDFNSRVSTAVANQFSQSAVDFNRKVFGEDKAVCEAVQKGFENCKPFSEIEVRPSGRESRMINFASEMKSILAG